MGSKFADTICGQIWSGETSASKPFDDASIVRNAARTRGALFSWDECAGYLATGRAAAGVKGA